MVAIVSEIGPENKISRMAACRFYGNPYCPCCGGIDKDGNIVKARWHDVAPREVSKGRIVKGERWTKTRVFRKRTLRTHRTGR